MRIKNQETMAQMLALQTRVRRYAKENSDLPQYQIARRFGMSAEKFKRFIKEEPPYPPRYKQAASKLGLDIAEVAENYEAGRRHCGVCGIWDDIKNFGTRAEMTLKHRVKRCREASK